MEHRYVECAIYDGKIFERKFGRDAQQIGVTLEVHEPIVQELEELIVHYNEYQDLLIEHKIIKKPMSPEEQVQRLIEVNEQQAKKTEEQIGRLLGVIEKTSEMNAKFVEQVSGQIKDMNERINQLSEPHYEPIDSPENDNAIPPEGSQDKGDSQRRRNDRGQYIKLGRQSRTPPK
jgi:DNA repair ATPase RecN